MRVLLFSLSLEHPFISLLKVLYYWLFNFLFISSFGKYTGSENGLDFILLQIWYVSLNFPSCCCTVLFSILVGVKMPIKIVEEDYNDELYAHFFKALFQLREIWSSIMINHESKVDTMRSFCLMPCSVMDLHGTFFFSYARKVPGWRQCSSGKHQVRNLTPTSICVHTLIFFENGKKTTGLSCPPKSIILKHYFGIAGLPLLPEIPCKSVSCRVISGVESAL